MRAAYAARLATFQPREGLALVLLNDTDEAVDTQLSLRRIDLEGTVLDSAELTAHVDPRSSATIMVPEGLAAFGDPAGELIVAELEASSARS